MLPDFAKVKRRSNRDLLRWVQAQVPQLSPLIQGVATLQQHEGEIGKLVRSDGSEATLDYPKSEFKLELSREEMRRFDQRAIQEKLLTLAKEIGGAQVKQMLKVVGEAADSVGNVVHAGGELTPDTFFELFRRVQMDFDPKTLEPKPGLMFVMHPDTAAKIVPKVKEWEKDPAFDAEYKRIVSQNREAWRDREANRKLAC